MHLGGFFSCFLFFFFFSSRRRHTRLQGDWSSDVCSSDLVTEIGCECARNAATSQPPVHVRGYKLPAPRSRGRQQAAPGRHQIDPTRTSDLIARRSSIAAYASAIPSRLVS